MFLVTEIVLEFLACRQLVCGKTLLALHLSKCMCVVRLHLRKFCLRIIISRFRRAHIICVPHGSKRTTSSWRSFLIRQLQIFICIESNHIVMSVITWCLNFSPRISKYNTVHSPLNAIFKNVLCWFWLTGTIWLVGGRSYLVKIIPARVWWGCLVQLCWRWWYCHAGAHLTIPLRRTGLPWILLIHLELIHLPWQTI